MPPKIKIDRSLLVEIGLSTLVDDEQGLLLEHLYSTLKTRTGIRIANQMTADEVRTFSSLKARDDGAAAAYLDERVPGHGAIVHEEWARLREELIEAAPAIRQESVASPWPSHKETAPSANPSTAGGPWTGAQRSPA